MFEIPGSLLGWSLRGLFFSQDGRGNSWLLSVWAVRLSRRGRPEGIQAGVLRQTAYKSAGTEDEVFENSLENR